jgi:site-specific recombinase XerD
MTAPTILAGQTGNSVADEISARLVKHARNAAGALAPETERALRRASAAFTGWAVTQGASAIPAAPETVAAYVDALVRQRLRPASIRQAAWAITALHQAASLPDPSKAEIVRLALKRMSRVLGNRQHQAAPLGEIEVARILATSGKDLPALRDVALVLTMRGLLARRSEAVALDVANLQFTDDGSATALIRRSKTDQVGAGEVRWLAPRTVTQLRRWMAAAGISEGPVFRPVNKGGVVGSMALNAGDVSRILKRLAERAGLEAAAISGHSARVGMAQDLVAGGADLPAVMQAGRWKSPTMPARYAERLLAGRSAVARHYERSGGSKA